MSMEPAEMVAMLGTFSIIGAVLYPVARAVGRRIEGKTPAPAALAPATDARLDRIEQAVEAIAVEVERISEGQRFTTRLLAERTGTEATSPRSALERGR